MKKNFTFINKNEPIIVTITADTFEEAERILFETVKDDYGWRVDDEDGEEILDD